MNKLINYFKVSFHILVLLLIIFSLYPGSILGFVIYGDDRLQPKITEDFLKISSDHFYTYAIVSFLGFISYLKDTKFKLVLIYLLFLSFVLELLHLIIPGRYFQMSDLIGNVLGVLAIYMIILIYKFWKNR